MQRLYLFALLLVGHVAFCPSMSQTSIEDSVSQKLTLISDSINTYQKQGDNQKVLSICRNGLSLLSTNNLFYTPASCLLFLQAGESCMNLKDYHNAKFYFYKSFVLDELGKLGVGAYTTILDIAESDTYIRYFKELLTLAKSDTVYLKMLAMEPDELGYKLNSVALENFNEGKYSSAIDFFEMEISLLDALGQTGSEDYLSIIPCVIECIKGLRDYNWARLESSFYLNLTEQYKGNNTIAYAEALQTKASVEDDFGNSEEAVSLYNESLSLIEEIKGVNNMDYIRCLQNIGPAYQNRDNNHIKFLETELKIEKLLTLAADATVDDKVRNLNSLSYLYAQMGDNTRFLSYAENAVDLWRTRKTLCLCVDVG